MKRVLTGIQATGTPHLGNILGAILPAIEISKNKAGESFLFIADLHALTTIKDPKVLQQNTYSVAAAWLALGLDTEKTVFYRQSDVPEVTEMTWYLNCVTPYPMLANAHSFKDKSDRLSEVNAGLFDYPVLMACDILMYDAHIVPVGKDQIQHLEITRDLAQSFNRLYGEILVVPEAKVEESVKIVPGVDGQKMSKSYNNYINIFQSDKALKKQVMSILTDDTPLEDSKDPDKSVPFQLFSLLASQEEIDNMRKNYLAGGYGYGHAKKELLEKIKETFADARENYEALMNDLPLLDRELAIGAEKARAVGSKTLERMRKAVGLRTKNLL